MNRLFSILFWSIISAAFIGPGTVTTAAKAGANFQFALLWALSFSTIACLVLQEASARITIVSGRNLGQAIREQFHGRLAGLAALIIVLGAILLGCAAYEAGNILGGVAGAALGTGVKNSYLTLLIGLIAGVLLWLGKTRTVAQILGGLVAFMGIAFLSSAVLLRPSIVELFKGTLLPALPSGSGLLVLGLIGTTVVPYNLFLGSGIARGSRLEDMRFGLSIAILLGGLISMGVLVVGTAVQGEFSFATLSLALSANLGGWAKILFALGLFAAGFSSAITAPLAAAITARSLFASGNSNRWGENSWRYRISWLSILIIGVGFGLANVKPIPAIILAQAFNGILLPFVALFLLIVVNDANLMGRDALNGLFTNIVTSIVVAVTIVLGISGIAHAFAAAAGLPAPGLQRIFIISASLVVLLAIPVVQQIRQRRLPPNQ